VPVYAPFEETLVIAPIPTFTSVIVEAFAAVNACLLI